MKLGKDCQPRSVGRHLRARLRLTSDHFKRGVRCPFKRVLVLSGFLLLLVVNASSVMAQDWQPELLRPPGGDFWLPSDPIIITIPLDVPAPVLARLALELDNFDVTSLVQREGNQAVLRLPEPLTSGEHRLRLVEYAEDGSILEHGIWVLQVRKTAAFQGLEAEADLAFDARRRVLGDNLRGADGNVFQSHGNTRVLVEEGNWTSSLRANYLYDSQDEQSLVGRPMDLGEYLSTLSFQNDHLSSEARLGHHDIGATNFIMSGFQRRGFSLGLGSADSRARVTGFAQASEALLGIDRISGVEDPDDRVQGAHLSVRPIEFLKDNLELTGTYYRGERTEAGDNDFDLGERSDGDGFSVAADTLWLGERLRLRGEFSRARFDLDGADGAVDPETDEAYSFLADYALLRDELVGGSPLNWNLGIQHDRLGTFYGSVANPNLQPDRITTTVFSDVTWDEIVLQAQAGYQTNNVNGVDSLPRDRTLSFFAGGSYTPYREPDEQPLPDWLGQPSFGLSFNYVDVDQTDTPAAFTGFELETQSLSTTASLSTAYETWSWDLSETVLYFRDEAGVASDTLEFQTYLGGQFGVVDRASLGPYVQWIVRQDQSLNERLHEWLLGLNSDFVILPEVLNGNFGYSVNLSEGAPDTLDTHVLGGELLWTFLQPEQNRPGLALSLSGSIEERNGDSAIDTQDRVYQVFVSLKTSLPLGY